MTIGIAGCAQFTTDDPVTTDPARPTDDSPTTQVTGRDDSTGDGGGQKDSTGLPVSLETVARGIPAPLDFADPPGLQEILYVASQSGEVFAIEENLLRNRPILDLSDEIVTGGERGLLGIALHPNFEENHRLFVRYSAPRRPGTPSKYSHTFVLAEYEVSADGLRVDTASERTILEIPEPQSNHNAGAIAFGPDNYLYIAVGDGGAANDVGRGHVEDWYAAVRGGNGQDITENLLGSILRIDIDSSFAGKPYGIPNDNPLVGTDGLDEHYAWGFRNPWRMSFTGDELFVGDVGQNQWEEVNIVEIGGNYAWNIKEGTHCFGNNSCPNATPSGDPLLDPIIEYPHRGKPVSGISVIGGFVYQESTIPALNGKYVFGDLRPNGRLFAGTRNPDGLWPTEVIPVAESDQSKLGSIFGFGRDQEGELYVLGATESGSGIVSTLVPTP